MLTIKSPEEIEIMREGGRKLAQVLHALRDEVREGVQTIELDRIAHRMIVDLGAKPAFLHYRPAGAKKAYPFTLCASPNDVVVHGQPSSYVLKKGDIIKLDLGLKFKDLYLDSAITVPVGEVSKDVKRLISGTRDAMIAGIKEAKLGNTLGDIGFAIQKVASKNKLSIAEGLIGHGIGHALHEDPQVFNFGIRGRGEELEEGMVIAIEPMTTLGGGAIRTLKDESYGTLDSTFAGHFEHTVAITAKGPWVLTDL